MSDIARFWSRSLRGLNFAEHAVCRELAEYHVADRDECFPNMTTLCDTFECSRDYLKRIIARLDGWNLVNRIEWFDPADHNRQTSNRYRLNLHRHFPDPTPEGRTTKDKNKSQNTREYDSRDREALTGAKQGRRFLRIISNHLPTSKTGLMDGIKESYFLESTKQTFLTVDADGYMREFLILQADLTKFIRHETNVSTTLNPVPLYFRTKRR